jgi:hypothetical protein
MKMPNVLAPLKRQVKGTDVLVGAGAGLVANVAFNYLKVKLLDSVALPASASAAQQAEFAKNPPMLKQVFDKLDAWGVSPVIAALLGGVGLYMAQKKSARAAGHLIGALGTGVALTGRNMIAKSETPEYARLAAYQNYSAPQLSAYGMVQDDYSARAALADLARVAADGDESALGVLLED